MGTLHLPEPYDFELSTGRYRAFGPDLANLWHEGALHRVSVSYADELRPLELPEAA